MDLSAIKNRLLKSKLFKDSFWAVFGNGMGNCILLVAGIIIARVLGKDLYGEYGMVKTTMFYIGCFATLGLGFTSTRFIADAVQQARGCLRSIIKVSLSTTFLFSLVLCILLFLFSHSIANWIEEPSVAPVFNSLGIIIIFRAFSLTSIGILAGFKDFKRIGTNSIISGLVLLVSAYPLTISLGLKGAFIALASSQGINAMLNLFFIAKRYRSVDGEEKIGKDIIAFTLPVSFQELSYMISTCGGTMVLTKYASLGEVGLWSAALQWNAIILFIPTLLANVVLSYLSGLSSQRDSHDRMLKKMLGINFTCSFIPFIIVYVSAGFIASFYGESFVELKPILRVLILSSVFVCLSNVYQSNLLSEGKNWLLLVVRIIRDALLLSLLWIVLRHGVVHAALAYSWIYVAVYFVYFILMSGTQLIMRRQKINRDR